MVSDALAYHIGPVAKVVVEQAAKQAIDVGSLYDTVATSISGKSERNEFLRGKAPPTAPPAASTPPASAEPRGEISAEDMISVQQHLAHHLGPIAKILTRRAAKGAGNRAELIKAVAEHIPSDKERNEFFRKLGAG